MAEKSAARSTTLPAPILGWNTRDPLDGMDPAYAISMDNWFPEERSISLRGGFSLYADTGTALPVESLIEHVGATGSRSLIAVSDDTMFNVSTATPASLETALNNARWQHVGMNNITVMVNGADQPQQWNGTATSDAVYTGIADDSKLIAGTNYRNRLYFIDTDGKFWYLPTLSVTGLLTEFPVKYAFRRGGYPMFCTTWTRDNGSYFSELLVIGSSEGEVLVYAGSAPDEDDFTLIGHVFLPKPIGRRSVINAGTEVEIVTQLGVFQLSRALETQQALFDSALTSAIHPTFAFAAKNYRAQYGWQPCEYALGKMMIYNVPVLEGSQSIQYVRNLLTGAWSRFTGINAACWAVYNDVLYFGGMDGKVYRAFQNYSDNGTFIRARLKFAFNYLNDREHIKDVKQIRPVLNSTDSVEFSLGCDADFGDQPLDSTVETDGTIGEEWDSAEWDDATWGSAEVLDMQWSSAPALGRCIAPKFEADLKNISVRMTAVHVLYEKGGIG